MFIDLLEEHYPDRVLTHLELDHRGFQVFFDLSSDHHLKIALNLYKRQKKRVIIYEFVQEYEKGRIHLSQGNDYLLEEGELPLLPTLKDYLTRVLGNRSHTSEDSFVGWLLARV